ncbi:hypothetical protein Hanom_Chr15g01359231 [Helianthus anomalus]
MSKRMQYLLFGVMNDNLKTTLPTYQSTSLIQNKSYKTQTQYQYFCLYLNITKPLHLLHHRIKNPQLYALSNHPVIPPSPPLTQNECTYLPPKLLCL